MDQAMAARALQWSSFGFSSAVSACEKASRWQAALVTLSSMDAVRMERDIFSSSAAISACAGAAKWEAGLALLAALQQQELSPVVITYNSVITACGNASQWVAALSLLQRMPMSLADDTTFHAASYACGEAGHWVEALQLLEEMQSRQLRASTVTLNTAITSCRWDLALHLLRATPHLADSISFSAACGACGAGRQWQWALELLEEALRRSMVTSQLWTSAISACESWPLALRLFRRMPPAFQAPENVMATISACTTSLAWDQALALLTPEAPGSQVGAVAAALMRLSRSAAARGVLAPFRRTWHAAHGRDPDLSAVPGLLAIGAGILAVQKPAGVATEAVLDQISQLLARDCSLVSRLDQPTSGVLPVVLDHADSAAASWFQATFASRLAEKEYFCLCEGFVGPVGTRACVDLPLATRHFEGGVLSEVAEASPRARDARTEYEVLRRMAQGEQEFALLRVHPVTGRTHQIRVHLAHLGHPLVGDRTYGASAANAPRLFLHCHQLSFEDLAGDTFRAVAPLPSELQDVLQMQRDENSAGRWKQLLYTGLAEDYNLEVEEIQRRHEREVWQLQERIREMQAEKANKVVEAEAEKEAPQEEEEKVPTVSGIIAGSFDAVEDVGELQARIHVLETQCATLQKRLNSRPIVYQTREAAPGRATRGAGSAGLLGLARDIVEQLLRNFTERLLKRDAFLWVFYAHLLILYAIAASCYAQTSSDVESKALRGVMKQD
ncbi:unnamed protein product [Effrenium voratum]|uniref:Pseudouridine synthase RsuA/RluA-like domain-containing protein n=1 Tax=Effrenium voratum TaxID=2562239 RepID=A0AA36IWB9_9DINO|nr:unnamed protein product [Effrenium voratum]